MTRTVFSDFDEFADSLRGVSGRFVPTARSQAEWWVQATSLGRMDLQEVQVGGAATYAGDGTPNSLTLGIPMTEARRIRIDGHALEPDSFVVVRPDQPLTFAARQATRWVGVRIRLESDDERRNEFFDAERITAHLHSGTRAQTDPRHLAKLRELITKITDAQERKTILAQGAAAAEQEVLLAVSRAIQSSTATRDNHIGRPQVSRNRVIARTLELIESHKGKSLCIDDLCAVSEVSERTLRNVFQEYFGVGPMRLLKVRQLLEIRIGLLAADPEHDTVTRIAGRFGVWDFSLFARNYKALYGESPSQTLRRPARATNPRLSTSWLSHAAKTFVDSDGASTAVIAPQANVELSRMDRSIG